MFSGAKGNFDRLVDKATSQLLLEPDWDAILQICDTIRQGDVTAKYAVAGIRRKLSDRNPHVCLYALQVLESVVKNCGTSVYEEVATKSFMDEFRELIKTGSEQTKNKILELIQTWSHAFRSEPNLKIVQDTYHLMKMEGYTFPPMKESDAMFVADKAPEWVDGDVCHRCRVEFGMVQRKHHCRHCGQVFCSKCSSKTSTIPKFGIEKEVRVCEACYEKINKPGSKSSSDSDLPAEYLASPLSQQPQVPAQKTELELQEEEDLQLAMALSLDEAENKERIRKDKKAPSTTATTSASSSLYSSTTTSSSQSADMDPELARYLNRSYWEQKHEEQKSAATPSAPASAEMTPATAPPISTSSQAQPVYSTSGKIPEQYQNDSDDNEHFQQVLSTNIDVFVNRMKSDSQRGRSIANDTSVQGLFQTITTMNPQLMKIIDELEDKRNSMESLQDKLAQLRDAREALDALREDHREKLRREAEEAERIRQIQIAQKLEIMRQKKQEYLAYQRQLALQRLQEQEREMQMRLEQHKHQQQMRPMQYTMHYAPQGVPNQQYTAPPQQQAYVSPPNSMHSSPVHTFKMEQQQQPGPGAYMEQAAIPTQPAQVNGINQGPQYSQPSQYAQQQSSSFNQGQQYPAQGGQYQQPQQPSSLSAPPSLDYHLNQPVTSVDYQSTSLDYQQANMYSMQSLASTLPQQNQTQVPQPGPPPPQPPQQQQQPQQPQQHYTMNQAAQGNMYQQQMPVQAGMVPPPQQQAPPSQEAALISFD